MAKFNFEKLKNLRQNIDIYLKKHDPSYIVAQRKKKTEQQLIETIRQLERTIKELGEKAGGINVETFVADSSKIKDVLSEWATEKLTPILDDLRGTLQGLKVEGVLETKDSEVANNLQAVNEGINSLNKKIEVMSKDEKQTKAIIKQLEAIQAGIEDLVAKEIIIPKLPSEIQIKDLNKLEDKFDNLTILLRTLSRNLGKSPKDRTEEIIKAIKEINPNLRFRTVEFFKHKS